MTDVEALTEQLRSELENYLSAIRQEEAVSKWLAHERFRTEFEEHEGMARKILEDLIAHYTPQVPADGPYRPSVLNFTEATLRICLDACKKVGRTTADALVNAFDEYPQISA